MQLKDIKQTLLRLLLSIIISKQGNLIFEWLLQASIEHVRGFRSLLQMQLENISSTNDRGEIHSTQTKVVLGKFQKMKN
jgi:hypothetical protein